MKWSNELSVLLPVMKQAGQSILELQKKGFSVSKKSNNDLLTEADLLANQLLKSTLMTHFPDDGWLSEECADDAARLSKSRTWIVDPIDGTIEYANGVPEYAISVALVEEGEPVLASVYNPASSELFYAMKGHGAFCHEQPIHCKLSETASLTLLASRSEFKRGEWNRFRQNNDVKVIGSIAYKLALVAAGRADAAFSLGPKSEWDIAAGVLLVQEAGGQVTDQHHRPFLFNRKDVRVDSIVATSSAAHARVFELIALA